MTAKKNKTKQPQYSSNSENKKFYVTTAIDYVNAKPHVGHAFEKVIADALVRWHQLQEKKTFFLTGTDENAQKNDQAAKAAKIDTQKFVDKNSKIFIELCKKLNIKYDNFIRTSSLEHTKKAQEIFKQVYDKKDIYKGKYEGYYCTGCEAFKTEKDLIDDKCPEHNSPAKWLSEETYFFKLSKYKSQVEKFVKTYIIPNSRRNEILSRLKSEDLKDLSVSRQKLDWGIPVPLDKSHTIYVWFDALINYISGSKGNWPADIHIIGKGINWFHSVIWPAMLFSANIERPKKLLVHGYLNLKGKKISKSLGNTIDPISLAEKYGPDVVRYSLLRCSIFEDSDYSEEILIERNNNELANKLGNLVSRVSTLAEKYGIEEVNKSKLDISPTLKSVQKYLDNYALDKALNEIFSFIDKCNEYIQHKKPWETQDKKVIYELANAIKDTSILLWPFVPQTSEKIAKTFNFKITLDELKNPLKTTKIKKSDVLFKKI